MFDQILGNEPLKLYLAKAVQNGRLPHALLFSGPDGIGKSLFAKALAQHLLQAETHRIEQENHPDFHMFRPEGKSGNHSIESLRTLIDQVHEAPFEAWAKVFVICEAEKMQPAAANALLKTLEEPNPDTTLILLSSSPKDLLPTILSRCIQLSFQPLSEPNLISILKANQIPERFAKLAHGSAGRAFQLAKGPDLEGPLLALLSSPPFYPELLKALDAIEESIESENPTQRNQNAERLFSTLLMWRRDVEAIQLKRPQDTLFFPEAKPISGEAPSYALFIKAVEEARLAFQRNMKISLVLEKFFTIFL